MMLSLPVQKILALVALLTLHGAAASSSSSGRHLQTVATQTIAQIVANDPDLTTLAGALAAHPDVLGGLSGDSFTLLAPTDAAFAKIAEDAVAKRVLKEKGYALHLKNLIALHVADSAVVLAANLTAGDKLTMSSMEVVTVGAGPSFTGPSNNTTSPAQVTTADLLATNGVIHKIDTVLLPGFWSLDVVTLAETSDIDSLATLKSLFAEVQKNPSSTAILAFAKMSQVTLFAPTDGAFEELGADAIATILGSNTLLLSILQNHVVVGFVLSYDDLIDGFAVSTLQNGPLIVSREESLDGEDDVILVGESMILEFVLANNGIIYTINNVVLSPEQEALLSGAAAPVAGGGNPTNAPVVGPTEESKAPAAAPGAGGNSTKAPVADAAKTKAPAMAPTVAPAVPTSKTTPMPVAVPAKGDKTTSAPVAENATSPTVKPMGTAGASGAVVAGPSLISAVVLTFLVLIH